MTHCHTKQWRDTDSSHTVMQTKKDAQIHTHTHTHTHRSLQRLTHADTTHTQAHTHGHTSTPRHTLARSQLLISTLSRKIRTQGDTQTHTQRHTDAEPDRQRQSHADKEALSEASPPPEPRHPSFAVPLGTLRNARRNSWDIS